MAAAPCGSFVYLRLKKASIPRYCATSPSSSQSPLSSVSACGENCACSLAPPLPTARGAAGAPFGLAKRETGRARSKRKDRLDALRRVRASARRGSADRCKRRFWPAFGHACAFCDFLNCRPVAGVPTLSGWLSHGIASLFAAAGCPSGELAQRADKGIGPYDRQGSAQRLRIR